MWKRIIEALRWVLALEPVVVQGIIRAALVVAVAFAAVFGWELDTSVVEPRLLALVAAVWLLAELLGAAWARRRVTPDVKVVEAVAAPVRDEHGVVEVVSGKANDVVPAGVVVREAGAPTHYN